MFTPRKQSPPASGEPPYHIRVVVTHVDPLASREPGLVLEHLFHKAQVTRINVMEQAMGMGQSASLLKRPLPIHNLQQSSVGPGPTFLYWPHPSLQDRWKGRRPGET